MKLNFHRAEGQIYLIIQWVLRQNKVYGSFLKKRINKIKKKKKNFFFFLRIVGEYGPWFPKCLSLFSNMALIL